MKITCGCGAEWTGVTRAHCSGCHLTFSTAGTFDLHRKDGACRRPEKVGLVERGEIWGYGGNRPDLLWQEKSEGLTAPPAGNHA